MIYNIYKIIIIILVIIFIKSKYFKNEYYSSIDDDLRLYDNLTDEQKKILQDAMEKKQTDIRYLASTDMEAILNVSKIVKNGSIPIPVGTIVAYYSAEVPQGWALCNGQTVNGHKTPDLRNRFVVSTGNKYNLNATGGSANAVVVSHNHSMNHGGNHNHQTIDGNVWAGRRFGKGNGDLSGGGGANFGTAHSNNQIFKTTSNGNHNHHINHSGESGTNKNLPPYYALTYIMKV